MEVPNPQSVYNGAQCGGAVASDIEVVPDTEDEVIWHGQSDRMVAQSSTIADRHAMSDDMDLDFEEVSGQPVQVNVVARSCDAVKGKDANERALVSNDDTYAGVPSQQWYDPMHRDETSGRHSRQSDGDTSAALKRQTAVSAIRRLLEN